MTDLESPPTYLSPQEQELFELMLREEGMADDGGAEAGRNIPRRGEVAELPLSLAQERLWFLDRLEPGNPTYNMPGPVRLRGALRPGRLAAAVAHVVRRHESLRTVFGERRGRSLQIILPEVAVEMPVADLSGLPARRRERQAERRAAAEGQRPFDLATGPLLRLLLLRLAADEHVFVLTVHHIVTDGWSMGVLIREIAALYESGVLPELPIQYADYALWQRERFASGVLEEQLTYWKEQLSGEIEALELPTDRPRPAVQSFSGGSTRLVIGRRDTAALGALARRGGATVFMALLAVFQVLLHRLSGQRDITVGSPITGRDRGETEGLIGFFLNTLVMRTDLDGNPSFAELLQRVRRVALAAYAHQEVPFERLLEELAPRRDLSRTPLFQVFFNMLNLPSSSIELEGLTLEPLALHESLSKFDLTVYAEERRQEIAFELVYNADLFSAARMQELLAQYGHLLRQAVADPETAIGRLDLVTPAARALLPEPAAALDTTWRGAAHEIFARHAAERPQRLAVADRDGHWSYGELRAASRRLAGHLRASGVARGDRVVIYAHRSAPLVAAILGVLESGAAFVMLDPAYPAPRLIEVVERARPRAWLAVAAAGEPAPQLAEQLAGMDLACRLSLPAELREICRPLQADGPAPAAVPVGPDDLAYVAFTSGSEGLPKGICGHHGSLSHFLPWQCREFDFTAEDRFSLLSGLAHDPLQRDVFTPLQIGAAVVIPEPGQMLRSGWLGAWMAREQITVAHLTPAMGQLLVEASPGAEASRLPALTGAFFVGDVLTRRDAARLMELAPSVRVVNYYGSTETQRAVGYHPVRRAADEPEVLPLGRGIPGAQLLVLGRGGRLAGIGELGEIAVRSPHVALGYLDDPGLTAGKLVPCATGTAGERCYRTGDLGRYRPDGEVVFAGRADSQVKVRGFRIELGEIESLLGRHPAVAEAVVAARPGSSGEARLVAWVVPAAGAEGPGSGAPAAGDLRAYLGQRLPQHMIPAAFVTLETLPLTPNGKVDRRLLPVPEPAGSSAPAAPASELERRLAAVWCEVLGVEQLGVEDNFFDLGGHSLLLVRLERRLEEELGRQLPLMDLFRYPNVRALADHLEAASGRGREETTSTPAATSHGSGRTFMTDIEDQEALEGIAIIGMSGRFPGAADVEELWRNLRAGVECVRRFTTDELAAAGIDPQLLGHSKYVRARGVLRDVELFDAAFFDVSPREAELMDPQQRLFLECAWEALEGAGYDPARVPGPVGVYGGVTLSSYLLHNLYQEELLRSVGAYQIGLGTDKDYITTRVSYKLDLKGPSVNVQSACSTSAVATVLACQGLLSYQCDMALAGGASIRVPQKVGYLYQEGGIDSSDGYCRAFDAKADGSVYGSGVGVVLLKRLEDALADGDPIEAVILGSAINNDGSAKVGFTAPSIEGQAEVIATAQALAGVDPASVGYVEAHGTGTALGDPIEVAALTQAFADGSENGPPPAGSCALGSIKTNLGHLSAGAGVAGLIKTVLTLKHREIPPSLHFEKPNPKIDFAATPFFVNDRLRPWESDGGPRRAGMSSFGLGGTNAHLVLEEAPERQPSGASRRHQLVLLSARTETALEAMTDRLAADLAPRADGELADVAYTLKVGRRAFPHRRMLVCGGREDACRRLTERDPRRLLSRRGAGRRPLAFLFSGLGDHYLGMARGLVEEEPVFRDAVDRAAELLEPELGCDLRQVLYPEDAAAPSTGGPDLRRMLGRGDADPGGDAAGERLRRTAFVQPVLFVIEHALARLLGQWGLVPEAVIGYSLGEYTAACQAGVMSFEDALELVARRARLIEELPAGAMLAVPLPRPRLEPLLAGALDLAAVNGPHLCVVSGPEDAVEELRQRLDAEGTPCRRLATSHAFHSRAMEPVAARLTELVRQVRLEPPRIPVLSNVTGTWLTPEEATDPGYWSRHLCGTVQFSDGLATLWQGSRRVLLEVGPGQGLTSLALQHTAAGPESIALPTLRSQFEGEHDQAFLLGALGKLWLAGVEVDWQGFYAEQQRRRVTLPTYPFERKRYWIEPAASAGPPGRRARVTGAAPPMAAPFGLRQRLAPSEPSAVAPPPAVHLGEAHDRPDLATPYAAASSTLERQLVALWQEILGIDGLGVHDSFFELGGHSLQGTVLLSRLREAYGVELPLGTLFEGPSVAELAAAVEAATDAGATGAAAIPALPRDGELPVSFAQQRLWFLAQLEPGNPFYNLAGAVRLTGTLNVGALRRSVQAVVDRHEGLRTSFGEAGGEPVQRIAPALCFELPLVDLGGLGERRRRELAARLARREARWPFDLGRSPLLRLNLLRLAGDEHILLLNVHHVVSDMWSNQVLLQDIVAGYRACSAGEAPALPALPVQYADFASWQREHLAGELLQEQLGYWRDHLAGAPIFELPGDRPRPPVQSFRGSTLRFTLPKELSAAVEGFSRRQGSSLFMTLLAAYYALLARHSGERDLTLGTPVANRTRRELEGIIGFFVNTLVLRVRLEDGASFAELLEQVRRVALGAYDHQDLPFELLVEKLQPTRDLSRNPLFQVMFNLLAPEPPIELPRLTFTSLSASEKRTTSLFDLTLYMWDSDDGLRGNWEYNPDLFDETTIRRLLGRFELLLAAAVASPQRPFSELPILPASERHQLLAEWSDTAARVPRDRCLHELLAQQAARSPEAVAVSCGERSWTYGELAGRAAACAVHLRRLGVGPGERVALSVSRSPEMLAALWGILAAGGAYVPVDPDYPEERRAYVLADSRARVVLTERALRDELPQALETPVLCLEDITAEAAAEPPEPLSMDPGQLAYVIYTSGSTGRPKGVEIPHRALVNFLATMRRRPGLAAGDVLLAVTSLSFDIAGLELYLPLLVGGQVVVATGDEAGDGRALHALLKRSGATVMQATPATWRMLLDAGWDGGELRALCGGEALSPALAGELTARAGVLWNLYGPTETTVWSAVARLAGESAVDIGRPIANTGIRLLDRGFRPVPIGVVGELTIGGHGLARGYLGRAGLTAERFVPDPFAAAPGQRLYRTGDLARQAADGRLVCLGRTDHQVKLRGYRIELGEIESVLAEHPAVAAAAVALSGDMLVAYGVPAEGGELPRQELASHLAERLPAYMVPAIFVALGELPLTPNRKVDRGALPAPEIDRSRQIVAPRDPVEEAVAQIWSEVLSVETVSIHDSFFELGGHSLLATQVTSRIADTFQVEVPLRAFFTEPTVANLAAVVNAEQMAGMDADEQELLAQIEDLSEADLEAELARLRGGSPAMSGEE